MNRDYYTVHEMTEMGPDETSYLHYSATFNCWVICGVGPTSREYVEGGYPFRTFGIVQDRINRWRNGREYRDIPIAIVHHVETSEIVEEIPATGCA